MQDREILKESFSPRQNLYTSQKQNKNIYTKKNLNELSFGFFYFLMKNNQKVMMKHDKYEQISIIFAIKTDTLRLLTKDSENDRLLIV